MLAEPRNGCMPGFVQGDGALLGGGHDFGFLLESADDAVYSIEKILLAHSRSIVACGYEGSLVADVGDVGSRETRRLTREEVDIYRLVDLDRSQVHLEDLFPLGQVG